jgi:hypothetical protein
MSLVQIPGTSLFRDTATRALINRDQNGLQEYQNKRHILANQKAEINNVKAEIGILKDDVQEIKQLLLQLLGKTNG